MGQLFLHLLRSICPDGGWGYFRASAGLVDARLLRNGNGNVDSILPNARTVRDLHESSRMINRIEEARTEKLLSAERA